MQPFQPACAGLSVVPGDSFNLIIRLFTGVGGARAPLQIAPGEVFALALGRTVCTTADNGAGRLLTLVNADGTRLMRQFTPAETGRLCGPAAGPLAWHFKRIPTPGVVRTYAQGALTLIAPTACGIGDRVIELVVGDGSVTIDLGPIPDAASYTDAREAAIRQDTDVQLDRLETEAFAAALLF